MMQMPSQIGREMKLVTRLAHAQSGEFMEFDIPLPNIGDKAQAWASAVSYGRRYVINSILMIASEDDDGNAASGRRAEISENKRRPRAPEVEDSHRQTVIDVINSRTSDARDASDVGYLLSYWGEHAAGFAAYRDNPAVMRFLDDSIGGALAAHVGEIPAKFFRNVLRAKTRDHVSKIDELVGRWNNDLIKLGEELPEVHGPLMRYWRDAARAIQAATATPAADPAPTPSQDPELPFARPDEPPSPPPSDSYPFSLRDEYGDVLSIHPTDADFREAYHTLRATYRDPVAVENFELFNAEAANHCGIGAAREQAQAAPSPPPAPQDWRITPPRTETGTVAIAAYIRMVTDSLARVTTANELVEWQDQNKPIVTGISEGVERMVGQRFEKRAAEISPITT
jgi:hypothetical protein